MSNFPDDPNIHNADRPPIPPGDSEPASQDTLFELMDTVQIRVTEHCEPVDEGEYRVYNGAFMTESGELLDLWWSKEKLPEGLKEGASIGELLLHGIFNTGQSAVIQKREPMNSEEVLDTILVLGVFDGTVDPYKTLSVTNVVKEEAFLQRLAEMPDDIRESFLRRVAAKRSTPEELAEMEEQFEIAASTGMNGITEGEAKKLMSDIESAQYIQL